MFEQFIFLLFSNLLTSSFAWKTFEPPLKLSSPNSNGIYEFDLIIEYTLTMYSYDRNSPIGYDVNSQSWFLYNSSLYAPCNASNFLANNSQGNSNQLDQSLNTVNQFDGLHKSFISINEQIPGDVIVVPLGAEIILRVKNRLNTESLSIHVHGLDKKGLWFTDGVAFLQQCPIPPNSDYSYRFIADLSGTHFYHGHLGSDRGDGIVGGFVVKSPNETTSDTNGNRLQIDKDYYVLLQEVGTVSTYNQLLSMDLGTVKYANNVGEGSNFCTAENCWSRRRSYDGSAIAFLSPLSALLINSKGWHNQNDLRQTPSKLPLTTFLIGKNENVKFRFVNGANGQGIILWLEYHKLIVVAADGVDVQPVEVDSVIIFPGERYDILIQGLTNPLQKNYRFIFETLESFDWELNPIEKTIGLANLQYDDSQLSASDKVDFEHSSCSQQNKCLVLNCPFGRFSSIYNYSCINVGDLENGVEIFDKEVVEQKVFNQNYEEYFINIDHDNMMNGISFKMSQGMPNYGDNLSEDNCKSSICETNPMSMSEDMPMKGTNDECKCFNVYNFTLNNIVQLTLYNMGNGGTYQNGFAHPFHLHGSHFYVMKLAFPPTYDGKGLLNSTNLDIPCTNSSQNCYGLQWTNPSWVNGNVDGMNKNPTLRDTIIVPPGGYVVIRFRAINAGWWFAHCHLLIHDLAGMAFAVRVGEQADIPQPPTGFPHSCGIYEQPPLTSTAQINQDLILKIAITLFVVIILY